VLALAIGRWTDTPPFATLAWTWGGLARGLVATAPLLLGLHWCLHTRWPPMARLVRDVETLVAPLFAGRARWELVAVALLAGVCEEALFRGVAQPALARHLPPAAAVALAAALFGAAHWVTPAYALLAGLVGAYLGWLALAGGNLLVPMVAHAAYDVVALAILTHLKPDSPRFVV
jgi:membrane protease YdiL (CAAX protease family)